MTALCRGRDPEWWDFHSDGARLALAICRRCPASAECAAEEPKPLGVIRAGVAYNDEGTVLSLCPTCGYPQHRPGFANPDRCGRCDVPSLTRWRADITRWAAGGISDTVIGGRLGATRRQVETFRRKQTTTIEGKVA